MQRRKFLTLGAMAAVATMVPARLSAQDFRAEKPAVWTAKSVDEGIAKLFGSAKTTESDKIKLTVPKVASNGGQIPVDISTDIPAKTVALFQDANPESAVMVWNVTDEAITDYSLKIKMKKSGSMTVVVLGKDGKLYSLKKSLDVALGGCEG
jgi:sulfur-oxidizing protein SoxY